MVPELSVSVLSKCRDLLTAHSNSFSPLFDAYFNDIERSINCLKGYETISLKISVESSRSLEVEDKALKFALIYLSCPIFEKKFAGISYLNQRVEQYKKESEREKERFRNVLLKGKVLNILYITGYHPEIARKSDELLAYLAPKLLVSDIKSLLMSAYEQSPEKGGVICYCLRKSLQILDIELIKSVLEIFTGDFPIEKVERETILLIIEIIKQSGVKSTKFYMFGKNKDGNKIVEDSIQLLWNCLDSKNNVVPANAAQHNLYKDCARGSGGQCFEIQGWKTEND